VYHPTVPGHTLTDQVSQQTKEFTCIIMWTPSLQGVVDVDEFKKLATINKLKDLPAPDLMPIMWQVLSGPDYNYYKITSELSAQDWYKLFETDYEKADKLARTGKSMK
jgi:hypothetical protein